MLIEDNLALTRAEPNGNGGTQFLYRVNDYGVAAHSPPMEEVAQIHWKVDIIKFRNRDTLEYDLCPTTELAKKTLTFRNDKSLNEFLGKCFEYFNQLGKLEDIVGS